MGTPILITGPLVKSVIVILWIGFLSFFCQLFDSAQAQVQSGITSECEVVNVYPHDPNAFTQGLLFKDGFLFESTGQWGQSTLRRVELGGRILQLHKLPDFYFGEGITIWKDKIIQLTWKSRLGLVYDLKTFKISGRFRLPSDGWGLTEDGENLIMSDGTSTLYFLDPETYRQTRRLSVADRGAPVQNINELEYVKGEIYANIWQTELIARISPQDGGVLGWIDIKALVPGENQSRPVDVANGIAYDEARDRLFVTGKLWPTLYEIRIKKQ
jgi:glutamine cyclotransferase